MVKMFAPLSQIVKMKWLDELAFVLSFFLLTVINKNELIGKWNSSPTSYLGWQLFFSLITFFCLLIHPKIRNEVKILNKINLILTLPICIGYFLALLAGAVALTSLPVPVFLALSNLFPASYILYGKRSKKLKSPVTLGAIVVCASVILICAIDGTEENRFFYMCVTVYSVMSLTHYTYLKRINLQVPDLTLVFYTTLISFGILLPFTLFNAIQSPPGFSQILPCLYSGFLNLSMQIFTFRVKSKNKRFLKICALGQLISVLLSLYLFESEVSVWAWAVIIVNWCITGFVLNIDDDSDHNAKFMLVVPKMKKNAYLKKHVNDNMT